MLQRLVINGPSVNLCHAADCIRDRQRSLAKCLLCRGLVSMVRAHHLVPRLPASTTPQTPGRECSSRAMRYSRRGCRSRRFDPRLAPERTYASPHRYAPDIEHGGQRGTGQRSTPSRFRPPRCLPGRWPGVGRGGRVLGRIRRCAPVNGAGSGLSPVYEPTEPTEPLEAASWAA